MPQCMLDNRGVNVGIVENVILRVEEPYLWVR